METSFVEWLNQLMHAHPLLAGVVVEFSTWGVPLFGVLAVGLWLLSPPGDTVWKRACAAGLSAAALGLFANQVISHLWDRARPYEAHPSIIPLLPRSLDPSFPSDHATFAFAVAGATLAWRRGLGLVCLAMASIVGLARIYVGVHWPSDIVGGAVVGLTAGYAVSRCLPLLELPQRTLSRYLPSALIAAP